MTDALQGFAGGLSPGRNATTTFLSAAISLTVHGAVFAVAILWMEGKPGAIDLPTDAISVELFHTEVVEATTVSTQLSSAPALASVESETGSEASRTAARAKMEEIRETKTPPAEAGLSVRGAEDLEIIRGHSVSDEVSQRSSSDSDQITAQKRRKHSGKMAKLTDPASATAKDDASSKKGGVRSRAARGSASVSGRVSASTGSALNYAAIVRARVAGRKPQGRGRRGTVVVSFAVTRSGGLGHASVARSSGDPGLDSSVLSAVRSAAPFPAPPPGAQLRFAMPFYFR